MAKSRFKLTTAQRAGILDHLKREPTAMYLRTRCIDLAELRDFVTQQGLPYVVMPAAFGFRLVRRVAR